MNYAHLHLILNHLPVIGSGFVFVLLLVAVFRKSEELKRVALGFLILVALTSIPVYLTGEPAEEVVEHLAGISEAALERHEEAAQFSFSALLGLGVLALVTLVVAKRRGETSPLLLKLTLLISVIVMALLGWTANLGGEIRHSEIRGDSTIQVIDAEE